MLYAWVGGRPARCYGALTLTAHSSSDAGQLVILKAPSSPRLMPSLRADQLAVCKEVASACSPSLDRWDPQDFCSELLIRYGNVELRKLHPLLPILQ